ncbi:MAG: hypothetical protein E7591_05235 [Ruminococcaceae bacterium]|nr:hypothetical protein [Oscillospiraceae bacterium]
MSIENNSFEYSYSAKEQQEIKKLREKYTVPEKKEESNLERLRRLDESVTKKASTAALILGVIGTLMLGLGMSIVMSDFGRILGNSVILVFTVGITFGVIGIALITLAYPVYNLTVKKERKRIAPEILRITDELMK